MMMEHRIGREFTDQTKDFVMYRSQGYDEISGDPLTAPRYHHMVPLAWARKHFPELPSWLLKSPENCRVVNHDTHVIVHRNITDDFLRFLAERLLDLQPRLI